MGLSPAVAEQMLAMQKQMEAMQQELQQGGGMGGGGMGVAMGAGMGVSMGACMSGGMMNGGMDAMGMAGLNGGAMCATAGNGQQPSSVGSAAFSFMGS